MQKRLNTIRCLHMTTFPPSGSICIWWRRSTLNLVWYVSCSTKSLLEAWFSIGSSQARKMGPKKLCMTRITLLRYQIKKMREGSFKLQKCLDPRGAYFCNDSGQKDPDTRLLWYLRLCGRGRGGCGLRFWIISVIFILCGIFCCQYFLMVDRKLSEDTNHHY